MNNSKIVEVGGVGAHNKGAHLMLLGVTTEIQTWGPQFHVALPFDFRDILRLSRSRHHRVLRNPWGKPSLVMKAALAGLRAVPVLISGVAGLVSESAVSLFLDASGFALSDQWGVKPAADRAITLQQKKDLGTPVVLLPQAFGPFETPGIASAVRQIFGCADLIYARDEVSARYAEPLLSRDNLRVAPDFTVLLDGAPIRDDERLHRAVVVIPNQRMLDKTSGDNPLAYLRLLRTVVSHTIDVGRPVVVLQHDDDDEFLAYMLRDEFPNHVRVISERDPLRMKALLAHPDVVVSSRYHGLMNALSQGTTAIATGWSHKYRALMQDYQCEDLLWSVDMEPSEIRTRLQAEFDESRRTERSQVLNASARIQMSAARAMWSEVRALIG